MWPRLATVALGVLLIAAPDVISLGGATRANDIVVGTLVAGFATMAVWGAVRPLRWIGFVLGLWLLAAPWVLVYPQRAAVVNDLLFGFAVSGTSLIRGTMKKRFDGGWTCLWTGDCG